MDRRRRPGAESERRSRGDRGAVLVEAALGLPLLLLLVFGILEYGLTFSDWHAVANSTRDGAREASVAGDDQYADHRILRAIDKGIAAVPDGSIRRIVIFEASGPGDGVPTGCRNGVPQVGVCNVYTAAHLGWDESEFGCHVDADPVPDPDRFWCPTDREVSSSGSPDYLGVYVAVRHDFVTGFFGDGIDLEDTTVFRLEPLRR